MVSNKPFKRINRLLISKGYSYKLRFDRVEEYDNGFLTILIFEDSLKTHYRYIFLDSATKWIIKSIYTERLDKFGYQFKKYLRKIENKNLY